jgi:ribulose-5-phosphate 4-epimerase/fuculose-1-phosphate aldolase
MEEINMGIAELEVMKGYIRLCDDGFRMGWHERNGGNFTYRMKPEEVAECRPFFPKKPVHGHHAVLLRKTLRENILFPPAAGSLCAT